MTAYENECEMWDAIAAQDREAGYGAAGSRAVTAFVQKLDDAAVCAGDNCDEPAEGHPLVNENDTLIGHLCGTCFYDSETPASLAYLARTEGR